MDNVRFYGLRPFKGLYGQDIPLIERFVATAYQASPGGTSVDLNIGDPVENVSDGSVALLTASTGRFAGVIVGVLPYYSSAEGAMKPTDRLPGATAWGTVLARQSKVLIAPPEYVFEIDVDDATTATTEAGYQAFVGENCDIAYSAVAGTARAWPKLDISTHNTTATLQARIVGISPSKYNQDFSGANVKLLVVPNITAGAPIYPTGV